MIQPEELRLGNLIWFNDAPKKVGNTSVIAVGDNLIYTDGGGAYPNECEGIKLTEEWLVKLGLERYEGEVVKSLYYYAAPLKFRVFKNGKISLYVRGELNERTPCKHVHQLQNLYYALTGKELRE